MSKALCENKIMSYATIKELVIDSYVSEGRMPSYESLTQKVRDNFPTSAWQKSHYSWYKSQIQGKDKWGQCQHKA
jgi:hypothetical protein